MNWGRPKSPIAGQFGRAALILGVAATAGGSMLLGAGTAQAVVGTNPGAVQLNPASGATSLNPTWSSSAACATGFQGSAVLREVNSDGTTNNVSTVVSRVTAPFSGTLQAPMSLIQAFGGVANGGTQELVVVCFSGPSEEGSSDPEMDIFVNYSADGSTYSTSATLNTTTTLTTSANPVTAGTAVTLTATETGADGLSHPAGSVQFLENGKVLCGPVAVDANGVATKTLTLYKAGPRSLSAVFTPANATEFIGSTGNFTETVTP